MIRKYLFLSFLITIICAGVSKADIALNVGTQPNVLHLSADWLFHNGDNKQWASPSFNDTGWSKIPLSKENDLIKRGFNGIGWFRLHVKVPVSLRNKELVMVLLQIGASEIYINGKLLHAYGKVGNLQTEIPYAPPYIIGYMNTGADSTEVIAVRFSAFKVIKSKFIHPSLQISFYTLSTVTSIFRHGQPDADASLLFSAIFFTMAMFHLLLFFYYRKNRSNFYYSILSLLLSLFWLYPFLFYISSNPLFQAHVNEMELYIFDLCFFLIALLLYSIFNEKYNWFFWLLAGITLFILFLPHISMSFYGIALTAQIILSSVKSIVIVSKAVRNKQSGAKIIAWGFIIFLSVILLLIVFYLIGYVFLGGQHTINFSSSNLLLIAFLLVWVFSIPTSMSIYLASDFARTNKTLALQLVHVKQLSEQNIEKEREKQQIIEGQKQELEVKVKQATAEVVRQKDKLSEKNKEVADSINYARRIQDSILPQADLLKEALGEYMLLYKPKDVVSGDFYWCHSLREKVVFAVADCTGHGVPGAFMSMIGNSLLNGIVIGAECTEANLILDLLRERLIATLQQSTEHITTRDGMDIAVCVWDKKTNLLQFAGANNSLYIVSRNIAVNGSVKENPRIRLSNEHLLEILPDKQPIGYQEGKMNNLFTKNIIQLHKSDIIFITSDGFTDQFGGSQNKKYTPKRFRELIALLAGLSQTECEAMLNKAIEEWKMGEEQTDDICVMGVRIT